MSQPVVGDWKATRVMIEDRQQTHILLAKLLGNTSTNLSIHYVPVCKVRVYGRITRCLYIHSCKLWALGNKQYRSGLRKGLWSPLLGQVRLLSINACSSLPAVSGTRTKGSPLYGSGMVMVLLARIHRPATVGDHTRGGVITSVCCRMGT